VQTRYSRANTMRSTICRDYVHSPMEEAARYHDGGMIVGIVKTALMTLRRRRGDEDLLCGVLKRNSKPNEAVESNLILVPSSMYSPLLSLYVLLLLVEFLLLCLPRDITFYGSSRNSVVAENCLHRICKLVSGK